jgi:hypothetical protein
MPIYLSTSMGKLSSSSIPSLAPRFSRLRISSSSLSSIISRRHSSHSS